jgi:hypothetical protein
MAPADTALGLDFLSEIVNVQWEGGGLAVEFGDKDQNAPKPAGEQNE